ncbi:MAG: hypothetical protein AAF799_01985 [Myxococcota bacterium]
MNGKDVDVMVRWQRESKLALDQLRQQRSQHEASLEAAMEAIRVHTEAVERIEGDIEVLETALACVEHEHETVPAPAQPLRPVATLPTAVGQH